MSAAQQLAEDIRRGLAVHETMMLWHLDTRDHASVCAFQELIDSLLATPHVVVEDDCWYTCPAATVEHDGDTTCRDDVPPGVCQCGRDRRVERQLRLLAAGMRLAGIDVVSL